MAIILGSAHQGEFVTTDQFNRIPLVMLGNSGRVDGTSPLNAATTVRAGNFVMRNASNELIISDGATVAGMALYDVTTSPLGTEIDRPLVFAASGGTAQLTRASGAAAVNVSGVAIRSAAGGTGTLYALTTDYTVVLATGVVTHVPPAGGSIVVGATNFASFDYQLTVAEAARETNYIGSTDYVSVMQSGLLPIAVGAFEVMTSRFDKNRTYTLNGAGSILYVDNTGTLTNNSASAVRVGRVKGLFTSASPRLWAIIDINGLA